MSDSVIAPTVILPRFSKYDTRKNFFEIESWKTLGLLGGIYESEKNEVQYKRDCSGLSPKRIQKVTSHDSLNCKSLD